MKSDCFIIVYLKNDKKRESAETGLFKARTGYADQQRHLMYEADENSVSYEFRK